MADSLMDALYRRVVGVPPAPAAPDRAASMPRPLRPGDPVGDVADPTLAISDPRAGGTLTGRGYPGLVAQDVASVARRVGVDPNTALAMGLQESTLGRGQQDVRNPLTLSANLRPIDVDADPITHTLIWTQPEQRTALDFHERDQNLDASLRYLKTLQRRLATSPEERQIQAYNGLGRPNYTRGAYGGL